MSEEHTYHVYFGGEIHGPFLLEQIEGLWARGIIPPDARYFAGDESPWLPVADLLAADSPEVAEAAPEAVEEEPATPAPSTPAQSAPVSQRSGVFWLLFFAVIIATALGVYIARPDLFANFAASLRKENPAATPANAAPVAKKTDDAAVMSDPDYVAARGAETRGDYAAMPAPARKLVEKYPRSAMAYKCLSDACYYTGAMQEALDAANKAIAIQPDDMMAWHDLGGIQMRLKHPLDAEAAYSQAMKVAPGEPLPMVDMADALMQNGQGEEALRLLQQAEHMLKSQPFDNHHGEILEAWAWFGIGSGYMAQQMPENALAAFKRAAQLEPGAAEVWMQIGDLQLSMQLYEEAIRSLETAARLVPDNAPAWFKLGRAYDEVLQFDDAIKAYVKALAIKHDYKAAQDALNRDNLLHKTSAPGPDATPDATSKAADTSPAKVKPDYASDAYIAGDPDYKIVKAAEDTGDYRAMLASAKKLVRSYPFSAMSYKCLGKAYYNAEEFQEALDAFEKAIKLTMEDVVAHHYAGKIHAKLKQYPAAEAVYKSALEFNPDEPLLLSDMAALMLLQGKKEEALQLTRHMVEALKTKPLDTHGGDISGEYLWNEAGARFMELGQPLDALAAFGSTTALDANDAFAWRGTGDAMMALKHYDEAVGAFEKVTQLSPKAASAWSRLGHAYDSAQKTSQAIDAYRKALELKSDDKETQDALDWDLAQGTGNAR